MGFALKGVEHGGNSKKSVLSLHFSLGNYPEAHRPQVADDSPGHTNVSEADYDRRSFSSVSFFTEITPDHSPGISSQVPSLSFRVAVIQVAGSKPGQG